MDGCRHPLGRGPRPPGPVASRSPAGLRRLVDLRLRGRLPRQPRRHHRLRTGPGDRRSRVVAHERPRALRQLRPPVERRALLRHHGDPPVGQVLHGRVARQPRTHLGDRALAFFGSLGTAFTGYLIQTNFDAQWISTQAKDGLNAAGIGAWFNVMDLGQMMLWHVSLLPLVVGAIVVVHIVLVRRHGVVPPIGATEPSVAPGDRSPTQSMPSGCSHDCAGPVGGDPRRTRTPSRRVATTSSRSSSSHSPRSRCSPSSPPSSSRLPTNPRSPCSSGRVRRPQTSSPPPQASWRGPRRALATVRPTTPRGRARASVR